MGDTSIEWTYVTWNPIRGCSRVSEGCRNCYAERLAARFSREIVAQDSKGNFKKPLPYHGLATMTKDGPRWTGKVVLAENQIKAPLRWREPRRIFVNSMSDLFHENVPDEWIDKIFAVMALARQHTFQCLTKRPQRMLEWFRSQPIRISDLGWPLQNVWIGVSVEDQATADERIPLLLHTPAAVRFVSYEPALGPIRLERFRLENDDGLKTAGLDWVIVGGESGPGARPLDLSWASSVLSQCQRAGVACFVKQMGAHVYDSRVRETRIRLRDPKGGNPKEWPEDLRVREFPGI